MLHLSIIHFVPPEYAKLAMKPPEFLNTRCISLPQSRGRTMSLSGVLLCNCLAAQLLTNVLLPKYSVQALSMQKFPKTCGIELNPLRCSVESFNGRSFDDLFQAASFADHESRLLQFVSAFFPLALSNCLQNAV